VNVAEHPQVAEAVSRGARVIRPHPGPQTRMLESSCYELLYGGQAGGGKTWGLVLDPLRWVTEPDLYSITFRRETPQLLDLLRKSREVFNSCEPRARLIQSPYWHWRFPSGAMIRYGHLETEAAAEAYQGHEIHDLNFDELTHFTLQQYRMLISRVRRTRPGLPARIRSTTNPGGVGHAWVFQRWGPWLDPECSWSGLPDRFDPETGKRLPPAESGQILWVLQTADEEEYVPAGTPKALSRTFIGARLEDNPTLVENDPDYEQRLLDNDPVRARQLRYGDWLVHYGAGLLFTRQMFSIIDRCPPWLLRCRFWDRAATEVKLGPKGKPTNDPDWTSGVRVCLTEQGFVIDDIIRRQMKPGDVWTLIRETAKADGRETIVGLEQEPGASGKFEADAYVSALPGYEVRPIRASANKVRRAGPNSAQAAAGKVALVRGRWNEAFLAEAEQFPDGPHDDQIDGWSGAHEVLTTTPLRRPDVWNTLPTA
jgi:predicted phage terminase large subunit-like protein